MDRRKFLDAATCGLLAAPIATFAQPQPPRPRIGFLASESASNQAKRLEAVRAGLRELGYVEGKNIVIEVRWAEGKYDRLPELAADPVNLRVRAIVASGAKATLAAKPQTRVTKRKIWRMMRKAADALTSLQTQRTAELCSGCQSGFQAALFRTRQG